MSRELPAMPHRIAKLPRRSWGGIEYPVPYFATWLDADGQPCERGTGTPDFRVVTGDVVGRCHNRRLCWICGEPLGAYVAGVVGPMCIVNGAAPFNDSTDQGAISSEPASHADCALWAAQACPFLTTPRMRRNPHDAHGDGPVAGFMITRNPEVCCVYVSKSIESFRAHAGKAGVMFRYGPPTSVLWFKQARHATREEVLASIESGYPALLEMARKDPVPNAVQELEAARIKAMALLPPL